LQKGKGFDSLIRVCRVLRDRGVPIDVELVGDGPQREPLERLSRDLGLENQVRFRGWLPFVEARESIRRAAVLVHPSAGLGDGAPNVIKEAMALGTPVVASAVAGIPDLLEGGRAGLLVPPKDPEALANAVGELLGDAALRQAVAERARISAESVFDLWKNGRALADVLHDRGAAAP
jgi:glycosyltransferase involved in cell wall biosynthesis